MTRNSSDTLRRPMDYKEKEFLLAHLLRIDILFQEAKSILKSDHFASEDIHYALIWQAAINLSDTNGLLPKEGTKIRLELEIEKLLADNTYFLDDEQKQQILGKDSFLEWAFELPQEWLSETDGRSLLTLFLEERLIVDPIRQLSIDLSDFVPKDLSKVFKEIQDSFLRVKSVGSDPIESAFPEEWAPKVLSKFSTNIPFLDAAMGGGTAPGEMAVVLGPSGVGKTTLMIQLATQGSLYQSMLHPDPVDKEIGSWFFFTYESPVDPDIRSRVWSHAASIHRDTLENMNSLEDLSKSDSLKPYEIEKYYEQINAGLKVPGEYERLMSAKARLSRNLFLVDMSGSNPDNPKIGCGGPEEVAAILKKFEARGHKIAGFVVDYAGLAVDRYMQDKNIPDENKRHYLARFVDSLRRNVAAPFGASGWVAHQLAGAVNSKSATFKQHHADAAECKTFCDNAWFAFNLGTKDITTSTCRITCTKTRRSAGDPKDRIIFIDGAFCTMLPGDKDYVMDIRSKRIIPRDMQAKIMQGEQKKPKPPNQGSVL